MGVADASSEVVTDECKDQKEMKTSKSASGYKTLVKCRLIQVFGIQFRRLWPMFKDH